MSRHDSYEGIGIDVPMPDVVIQILSAIDSGDITLEMTTPHGDTPMPEYLASNGWRFRVFDDAGEWDYIDDFAPRDGEWFGLWENSQDDEWSQVRNWCPKDETKWHWVQNGVSPSGFQ